MQQTLKDLQAKEGELGREKKGCEVATALVWNSCVPKTGPCSRFTVGSILPHPSLHSGVSEHRSGKDLLPASSFTCRFILVN